VRRHAKASSAGSIWGRAAGLFFLTAALLALTASSALAAVQHPFLETFGSANQPVFTEPSGLAVDQASGELLVIDSAAATVSRYNPDGSPSNFSVLGSNVIDGLVGGADETPQGGLSFGGAGEVQVAVDNSGGATDGNIYVTQSSNKVVDIFADDGTYLGQLSGYAEGPEADGAPHLFEESGEPCGVAVDPLGNVYIGDYAGGAIHKYEPAANPPLNADSVANFEFSSSCTLAAGAGPSGGFIFPAHYSGPVEKLDATDGSSEYEVTAGENRTVSVDPASGHLFSARGSEVAELDASGASSASEVSRTFVPSTVQGLAIDESSGNIYVSREGSANIEVRSPQLPPPQSLTIKKGGSGEASVESVPAGLSCGFACAEETEPFGEGEVIELQVSAPASSKFAGWSTIAGDPGTCTATTSPCQVTLTAAIELQAKFDPRPLPSVSAIAPTQGPTAGGNEVEIIGTGLADASQVEFANLAVFGPFSENTDTTIKVKAPGHAAGSFDVTVTTGGGTSAKTAADQYTFLADPAVFALSPNKGPSAGGNQVVITGANLAAATAVRFGDTVIDGSQLIENSATQIKLNTPAHAAGTVNVRVTTTGGTSLNFAADDYTYEAPAPPPAPLIPPSSSSLSSSPPPPGCLVPKLKGQSLAKARSALTKAHCALGEVAKPKQKASALIVGSSKPGAGAALAAGAKVDLRLKAKPNRNKGRK
jgi:hypothetical protein